LHCTAMFSEQFPDGDRGGNLALIRIRTSPVELHAMWDGLLGKAVSASSIGKDVSAIEKMLDDDPSLIREDFKSHLTFDSWAKESFEVAKRAAYLNGDLKMQRRRQHSLQRVVSGHGQTNKDNVDGDDIPVAPDDYAHNAGRSASIQIAKAGMRLAD